MDFLKTDPWKLIEERFDPARVLAGESLFALGNGVMGGRANFEEHYSGPSLRGHYIGGVYYPDKTRVGWWKNGYPDYFAKVLNAAFWIGVDVSIGGERLDLAACRVTSFYRELDMRRSVLTRRATVVLGNGIEARIEAVRFLSLERRELGAVRYSVTLVNSDAEVVFAPFIDADVRNADANYDEKFWEEVATDGDAVQSRTRKSGFEAAWAQRVELDGAEFRIATRPERVEHTASVHCRQGATVTLSKYVGICSSLNHAPADLIAAARAVAADGAAAGFDALLREQEAAWARRWHRCDVAIEGDDRAQQGIRFCIFMLLQTYTGVDARLNIGPKGFTGEKYGGVTYWDTEAYCLPFYLSTAGPEVARQLLVYRYDQLDKAIENAAKLGFRDGAALYPMVTVNGEECHNEWEITFEEIHRNGAIAHAICHYVRYTGDERYLAECGLEVLLSIARFWAQRITWSEARQRYVLLGVTGPNEYENNVDNNWYTSYIACWSMRYAAQCAERVRTLWPDDYARICRARSFDEAAETARWREIAGAMYLGEDPVRGIFLQQDGYLDKVQTLAADLDPSERPINRHWSWDRILRSSLIKQADVLQGLYFFQEEFDLETLRRNFGFYEPRTIHESSLSPCVHAILAARLGEHDKAYELYLRTARLDLDDYNREVEEGCHVTSMAGSWLSVVEGFGGMRMRDGRLDFSPALPRAWRSLTFRIDYRGRILTVTVSHEGIEVSNEGDTVEIGLCGRTCLLTDRCSLRFDPESGEPVSDGHAEDGGAGSPAGVAGVSAPAVGAEALGTSEPLVAPPAELSEEAVPHSDAPGRKIGLHPEWSYQAVLYEMNVRQLTPEGTLRAAAERLPFLRELGIDAVWLMPIHPIGCAGRKGSLGSYYSVRDYCAVNPELGTMADFDAFVARAHALGMKVLLDWVANHTARDARWIDERPASWYERDAQGQPAVPWDWTDTAKLNYAERGVWEDQIAALEFWVREHAVDGFRCDMAMLVPTEFWNEAARRLRALKPDLFLLAEAEEVDLYGAFDACYAWRLHHLMNDVAQQRVRVPALRACLYADRDTYPEWAMPLVFTSNHDENSWSGSEFARLGAAREAMAAFTFVAPRGLPLIYTGQEVGYDHSFAFFDRDPIPAYEANASTELYRRLARLRHAHRALASGDRGGAMIEIGNNAEDCLMTFVRECDGDRVLAAMNLSPYAIHADYRTGIYAGTYTDALSGARYELPAHVEEDLAPWSYRILTR